MEERVDGAVGEQGSSGGAVTRADLTQGGRGEIRGLGGRGVTLGAEPFGGLVARIDGTGNGPEPPAFPFGTGDAGEGKAGAGGEIATPARGAHAIKLCGEGEKLLNEEEILRALHDVGGVFTEREIVVGLFGVQGCEARCEALGDGEDG
jgi:hypothetical protein